MFTLVESALDPLLQICLKSVGLLRQWHPGQNEALAAWESRTTQEK